MGGSDLKVEVPDFGKVEYTGEEIDEDILDNEEFWAGKVIGADGEAMVIGEDYVVSYRYRSTEDEGGSFTEGLPTEPGAYSIE